MAPLASSSPPASVNVPVVATSIHKLAPISFKATDLFDGSNVPHRAPCQDIVFYGNASHVPVTSANVPVADVNVCTVGITVPVACTNGAADASASRAHTNVPTALNNIPLNRSNVPVADHHVPVAGANVPAPALDDHEVPHENMVGGYTASPDAADDEYASFDALNVGNLYDCKVRIIAAPPPSINAKTQLPSVRRACTIDQKGVSE
jgi:hypothetical protein